MMPCCNRTGKKYLNLDRSIDRETLQTVLDEEKETRSIDEMLKLSRMKGGICTCHCHTKGHIVLH